MAGLRLSQERCDEIRTTLSKRAPIWVSNLTEEIFDEMQKLRCDKKNVECVEIDRLKKKNECLRKERDRIWKSLRRTQSFLAQELAKFGYLVNSNLSVGKDAE